NLKTQEFHPMKLISLCAFIVGCGPARIPHANLDYQKPSWTNAVSQVNDALSCPWFSVQDSNVVTPLGTFQIIPFPDASLNERLDGRTYVNVTINGKTKEIDGTIEMANCIEGTELEAAFAHELFHTLQINY